MNDYAARVLREGAGDETARMELAKIVGLMDPRSPLADRVEDLLLDASPDVVHLAIAAAGRLRRRASVPLLLDRLSDPALPGGRRGGPDRLRRGRRRHAGRRPARPGRARGRPSPHRRHPFRDARPGLRGRPSGRLGRGAMPALDRDLIDALDRLRARDPALRFDPGRRAGRGRPGIGPAGRVANAGRGLVAFQAPRPPRPRRGLGPGRPELRRRHRSARRPMPWSSSITSCRWNGRRRSLPVLERLARPEAAK